MCLPPCRVFSKVYYSSVLEKCFVLTNNTSQWENLENSDPFDFIQLIQVESVLQTLYTFWICKKSGSAINKNCKYIFCQEKVLNDGLK